MSQMRAHVPLESVDACTPEVTPQDSHSPCYSHRSPEYPLHFILCPWVLCIICWPFSCILVMNTLFIEKNSKFQKIAWLLPTWVPIPQCVIANEIQHVKFTDSLPQVSFEYGLMQWGYESGISGKYQSSLGATIKVKGPLSCLIAPLYQRVNRLPHSTTRSPLLLEGIHSYFDSLIARGSTF